MVLDLVHFDLIINTLAGMTSNSFAQKLEKKKKKKEGTKKFVTFGSEPIGWSMSRFQIT